jgi:hypothetical protein
MADIPVPFTGQTIDTDDGARGVVATLALMAVGFVVLALMQAVGSTGAEALGQRIANFTGINPATGDTDGGLGAM